MSQTAPSHYVQQWKATALHQYQSTGFALRNTTTPPEKITGEKMHFPIFGIVEAEENVQRGDTAKPANANDTTVAVDTDAIARLAAKRMIKHMNEPQKKSGEVYRIPGKIIRGSL